MSWRAPTTWRTNPGALRVRTRDGDTVAADELTAALAAVGSALAALDVRRVERPGMGDEVGLLEVVDVARLAVRLAADFGVVEVGPGVEWARRLLAELLDDGVKPSTLRDLEAVLPVPGAAVLTEAHAEAVGGGLTPATVAKLRAMARVGDP